MAPSNKAVIIKKNHTKEEIYTSVSLYKMNVRINPTNDETDNLWWKYYGSRGLKISPRYSYSVEGLKNLISDIGVRPNGYTIDRINNDLGYIEGNIRWSTRREQQLNSRNMSEETKELHRNIQSDGRNKGENNPMSKTNRERRRLAALAA